MPTFVYKAKKGPAEVIEGVMDAENEDVVVSRLIQGGLSPVRIEKRAEKIKVASRANRAGRPVSSRDLNIFTSQLATLIHSGVEILRALSILAAQTKSAYLKDVVLDLQSYISDGKAFSEAISQYKNVFSSIYVNLVRVGEVSGKLDESLKQLATFLDKQEELKSKVRSALAYPALMIIIGIATIFVLVSFVIPKVAVLFSDFEQALPFPTQILLNISSAFSKYWMFLIAGLLIVLFLVWRLIGYERHMFDRFKLSMPVLGDLMRKQAVARFSSTFSLLLKSGVPVFQALEIATPTTQNSVLTAELETVRQDVVDGSSIAKSIRKAAHLPEFLTHMIAVGEESGKLDEVLANVSESYTREVDISLKTIVALLEPAIIIILGLVIGFIVIAMLLPIFQISIIAK